jgi:hypothetical protein
MTAHKLCAERMWIFINLMAKFLIVFIVNRGCGVLTEDVDICRFFALQYVPPSYGGHPVCPLQPDCVSIGLYCAASH